MWKVLYGRSRAECQNRWSSGQLPRALTKNTTNALTTVPTLQLLLCLLPFNPAGEVRALAHIRYQQLRATDPLLRPESANVRLVGIANVDDHGVVFPELLMIFMGLKVNA
jgi:hypothetical protein